MSGTIMLREARGERCANIAQSLSSESEVWLSVGA